MKYYGVAILPIDNEGNTTLIGQYRYLFDRFTLELPRGGGHIDTPPLETAKKELSEETGFQADKWLHLFTLTSSPGLTDELAPCFVAWDLQGGNPHPDPQETIFQRRIRFDEAVAMALSGDIADLASVTLILGLDAKLRRRELPEDLARLLAKAREKRPNG